MMKYFFVAAVVAVCSLVPTGGAQCAAEPPTPYLHLSFDSEFRMTGTGIDTLKSFPGSAFAGLEKLPAGEFVDGAFGKAFVPKEDLIIQGAAVLPQPEGSVSFWMKPVNYQADWLGGKDTRDAGKIGRFFTASYSGEVSASYDYNLQPRGYDRWDSMGALNYYESWWSEGPRSWELWLAGSQSLPFDIWQDGTWRMVTIVWTSGERRIYFNGLPFQTDVTVPHTASVPATRISFPAGSKTVDELTVWDVSLTDAQVAANFYSRMPGSGLNGAVQSVPRLPVAPNIGKEASDDQWGNAVKSSSWVNSYSGMASGAKDTIELGHRDGYLFIRYREPMPEDFAAVTTLLGGNILKAKVAQKDGDVWADDCVEVRLTGDGGKTNYVFATSASGALFDARDGDKTFDAADWVVRQDAGAKFWTVEMKINLGALRLRSASEPGTAQEWGFNIVRTVRQQGYTQRQWSFDADNGGGYGRLILSDSEQMPVSADMRWSQATSELSVATAGVAQSALTVSYSAVPLNYVELFPEDKVISGLVKGREDERFKIPPASRAEQPLEKGDANWQGKLDYLGNALAVATLSVKDSAGTVLSSRTSLISASRMFSMQLFDLPSSRKLGAELKLVSDGLAGKDVVAEVSIAKKGETTPLLQTKIDGFRSRVEEADFDVSGLASGDYMVEATITKGGQVLGKERRTWFISGPPQWLGNDIGVLKKVPEPWTPVRQKGSSVDVWGRKHSFAGSLLPASMKVLDQEILAGPMRLIIETADETIDTAKVPNPSIAIDKAGLKAHVTGKATGKKLIVEVDGELEFDGFGYFTFTLKPINENEPVAVKSIIFEVPFKKKYAELYDDSNYEIFETRSGLIPKEGMSLAGTDTVRVGDGDRGVQFYPMFGQLGTMTNAKPLAFTPTATSMIMRYSISEGVTVNKPLTSSIGFMGTPVKPRDPERIRKTGHCDGPGADAVDLLEKGYSSAGYGVGFWTNLKGVWGGTQAAGQIEPGYYNYSPEWCADLAKSRKEDWEKSRSYWLLKMQLPLITEKSPEYAVFWKEWGGRYSDYLDQYKLDLANYRGADARPPGGWTEVNWAARSYQDYFIYSLDKVLRAFAAEGVRVGYYFDCSWYQGKDPRPYRQFMQRMREITRKYSPDGLIVSHMSGDRRMAIWSMVDVLFEGEQFSAKWRSHMSQNPGVHFYDSYPTLLPLDRVRASYAGALWGPQPVFLTQLCELGPEPSGPGKNPIDLMRYGVGLMESHDSLFWYWGEPFGKKANTGVSPWIARARWGWDEKVKFVPYWDSKGMLELDSPDKKEIVASAWVRPGGDLMAIIFNNTDSAATVRLKIDARKSPVKLKAFSSAEDITSPTAKSDATTPDVYEYKDGIVEVDMRPRDFRLLIFK